MLVVATTERLGDSSVPCLPVNHATGARAKPLLGWLADLNLPKTSQKHMSAASQPSPSQDDSARSETSDAAGPPPIVGVIMGSRSDWETMQGAAALLEKFGVPFECRVVSAHRTPNWMVEYASNASERGLKVIIAAAGGAAHLPGMVASLTHLPVLGVPVKSRVLNGVDSLLSIVQMPGGVPVGTLAIGEAGAKNAALLAIRILATSNDELTSKLIAFGKEQTDSVLQDSWL